MNVQQAPTLVAETVDRFLAAHGDTAEWERVASGSEGWSRARWREMAKLGWLGICLPESAGGLGCGIEERMAVMEAVGRGLVLEPYLSTAVLCAEFISAGATDLQRAAFLPAIAAGDMVLAFAGSEPASRFETCDVQCSAQRNGDGWALNGAKIAVLDAPIADHLLVLARTDGERTSPHGLSVFVVEPAAPGVTMRGYPTLDRRRCADIEFIDVHVGASALVGAESMAFPAVELALDHARVALCSEAVGIMDELVTTTIAYLKQRQQFGKPLAQFQVLRHRVADMHIACEQARSMAQMASATLLLGHPARSANAAAAKAQAGWSARFVGQQAVQLHGGMGVSNELRVGHWFKRLMAIDILLGNADHQVRRFGELVSTH